MNNIDLIALGSLGIVVSLSAFEISGKALNLEGVVKTKRIKQVEGKIIYYVGFYVNQLNKVIQKEVTPLNYNNLNYDEEFVLKVKRGRITGKYKIENIESKKEGFRV